MDLEQAAEDQSPSGVLIRSLAISEIAKNQPQEPGEQFALRTALMAAIIKKPDAGVRGLMALTLGQISVLQPDSELADFLRLLAQEEPCLSQPRLSW